MAARLTVEDVMIQVIESDVSSGEEAIYSSDKFSDDEGTSDDQEDNHDESEDYKLDNSETDSDLDEDELEMLHELEQKKPKKKKGKVKKERWDKIQSGKYISNTIIVYIYT